MNEITRIHLARISYEIDIDAKRELEKYLTAIKRSLGEEADAIEDIEIRMTEILAARGVTKDSVITESDLKAIKAQLGEPKDFSTDTKSGKKKDETVADRVSQAFASKKYFRDSDNAILGGVIAGLSAYTGWDVTLLRVLAVLLVFCSWGFLTIAYVVVWICAPEANSVSKKLEMRGEPVNLDSIKESAREVGERAEKAGKEVSARARQAAKKFEAKAPSIGNTIGRIFLAFFGVIGLFIVFGLIVATVIAGNRIFYSIAGMDIASKPLLVVTVSLTLAFLVSLISIGITISVAFLAGSFSKGYRKSLIASVIIAAVLLAGMSGTSTAWWSIAGNRGVEQVVDKIIEDNKDSHYVQINGISDPDREKYFCIGICR